jgi:hypothetical protein
MRTKNQIAMALAVAGALGAGPAAASLATFQTFTGQVGYSADGWGNTTSSGTISASAPVGSTVLAAYLYTSYLGDASTAGGTLDGNPVSYGAAVPQSPSCCGLGSRRADVTSIVAPVINGGPGGIYNFTVGETDTGNQDGEALVVVYTNPTLSQGTFGLLDGFSASSGDSASINFASPLDPAAPGFFAEMFLGIGFSANDQSSSVTVNGTLITQNAGNNDDGTLANGGLITVGGFNDPYSPLLPNYADDHERYNLVPYITNGDTSISIQTQNPSGDDNIFLAGFYVSGEATVTTPSDVPEIDALSGTGALTLLAGGLALAGERRRRAK